MICFLIKEIKELFSKKKIIISGFIAILAITLLLFLALLSGDKKDTKINVGLVDLDNNMYSAMLIDYFKNSEGFSEFANIITGNEEDISKQFREGKLDCYLVVPKDFIKKMVYIENIPIKVRISSENEMIAIVLKNVLEGYEKYIGAVELSAVTLYDQMTYSKIEQQLIDKKNVEISYSLITTALGRNHFFNYEELKNERTIPLMQALALGIISIILLFATLPIGINIIEEYENKTIDRIRITGKSIFNLMISKILIYSTFIFIIVLVPYLIFTIIGKKIVIKTLLLSIYIFIIVMHSLFLLLAMIIRERLTYVLSANLITFLMVIVGGSLIPSAYLPNNLLNIGKLTPNYYLIQELYKIFS